MFHVQPSETIVEPTMVFYFSLKYKQIKINNADKINVWRRPILSEKKPVGISNTAWDKPKTEKTDIVNAYDAVMSWK